MDAKMLGVTIQTLRNWDVSGKFPAKRTPGGTRYYIMSDIRRFSADLPAIGLAWATSVEPTELPSEYYCEHQDRFTSRIEGKLLPILLRAVVAEDIISLLLQAVGEIGDNSFAHNAANWPDTPGVFFAYDTKKRIIVLADRGQGVRATLRRVRPELETDTDALRVAFTEILSGRAPERRGNGLKVVRRVAESGQIGLEYRSGLGTVRIPGPPGPMEIGMTTENIRGTYAVITY
jgi:hypothetical protein